MTERARITTIGPRRVTARKPGAPARAPRPTGTRVLHFPYKVRAGEAARRAARSPQVEAPTRRRLAWARAVKALRLQALGLCAQLLEELLVDPAEVAVAHHHDAVAGPRRSRDLPDQTAEVIEDPGRGASHQAAQVPA